MSKHHVTIENGVLTKFVCEDAQGECHTYPRCDCPEWSITAHAEEYGPGHELAHHEDCWMQGWFDTPESTSYNGDGNDFGEIPRDLTRDGYIDTEWDECVGWRFTEEGGAA